MIYKSYKNLPSLRRKYKNKKIVFCSGNFDLLHAAHILFFEHCKKFGDILAVGVGSDLMTRRIKGKGRPILNQHIRLKMVDAAKPVDYCFLDESTLRDHPLREVEEVFKILQPDVYVFNKGAFDTGYRKKLAAKYGVKTKIINRHSPSGFKNISTTQIINKIKKSS